ncbi:Gfo/Idh/MocA family protein [Kribbella speibonae]|uniref:Gfo/Idh/MocA family oxidoreductase n=1 Tax=Kribbella speibonae TaxID=1572660 RepID=A0A4R0J3F0_9ACTN|nr:Gfo/Idh/MocA family oxidoreductase [Kribbella speibonae]TCC21055.1 Gfo/Idh/MocA family oxidoreductase [Kribbella speibonae]TCC41063.1 Gfo/Idh/MocA family oxidoreductase [Kribbella speibonae]
MTAVGVGVVGAGVISDAYIKSMQSFPDLKVVAIGDLRPEAAKEKAEQYGIETHGGPEAVLSNPDVEIVVNLTIPVAHVEVALAAVAAGKHVWSEKPFSLDQESGLKLLATAQDAGVRLGCAPDTILGPGLQESRRIIERGDIGTPLTALTLMQSPGPESWHPNPAFLFQEGAGPLWDIGPYYLTTLVQLFGPVAAVAGIGSKSKDKRTIGSGPLAGTDFDVTVPTHVSAIAKFESGQSSQSIFSFDSPLSRGGFVEISGSEATLAVPDPNGFDGAIKIRRRGAEDWETIAETKAVAQRGTGVLEMARAIRADRPHRATGALAFHIVDVMASITDSIDTGAFVDVKSTVEVASILPDDWDVTAATL